MDDIKVLDEEDFLEELKDSNIRILETEEVEDVLRNITVEKKEKIFDMTGKEVREFKKKAIWGSGMSKTIARMFRKGNGYQGYTQVNYRAIMMPGRYKKVIKNDNTTKILGYEFDKKDIIKL